MHAIRISGISEKSSLSRRARYRDSSVDAFRLFPGQTIEFATSSEFDAIDKNGLFFRPVLP